MKRDLMLFSPVIFFLIFVIISIPLFIYAQDHKYIASKFSIKYHQANCKRIRKIQPQNRVTFPTAKQALEAGYMPCPICKPPNKDLDKEKEMIDNLGGAIIDRYLMH